MRNALLNDDLDAKMLDRHMKKFLLKSGLIVGLCISSIAPSYAVSDGMTASNKGEGIVAITQQSKRITGVVKDNTGEPIVGANVVEKGTTNGTVTDANGKYTLSVSNSATLNVSFIGYTTKEVKVGSESTLKVV